MPLADGDTWLARVAAYIEELSVVAETMDLMLEQFRPQETLADLRQVDDANARLAQVVVEMERMVGERESLLSDEDAPKTGSSLAEKLRESIERESQDLAARCDHLSRIIADSHQRAIALFVCQFHLAELSSEIVDIFSGTAAVGTYGPSRAVGNENVVHAKTSGGGGLFNEAG